MPDENVRFKVEVIGDIAIIKPPHGAKPDLELARRYGEELLKSPSIKSAWLAEGPVEGPYKVRSNLVYLAGERRTETIYREHGCSFKVDIAKDFITPRLSYEHLRVAKLVRSGEIIVNMFAGVGIFSIIIARHSDAKLVHSIDINPDAFEKMVENVRLNKVEGRVLPYLGDAANVVEERLRGVANRVLMPLPDLAIPYFKYAVDAIDHEGYVHVYLHVHASKGEDPEENARKLFAEHIRNAEKISWSFEASRIVRMVGPRFYQVVLDVYVKKL
ncbi:Methyltransferase [Acidilobus saccharovorans 345-15]|uniref:Methyltransferase n=1 Tax=Acidilobus saccharovorans (strain DSM 16705 / JCM 18335 / VKM B-2471 / 345-15) TaxID=666510 RepID=D9Q290_ACIS3|nr:50S ribosomal protein L11 methyltransferase [Acidilobus saccharovorans]ADL19428.1 Methyltransferase [Acidilobus saccharovorans 345-15]